MFAKPVIVAIALGHQRYSAQTFTGPPLWSAPTDGRTGETLEHSNYQRERPQGRRHGQIAPGTGTARNLSHEEQINKNPNYYFEPINWRRFSSPPRPHPPPPASFGGTSSIQLKRRVKRTDWKWNFLIAVCHLLQSAFYLIWLRIDKFIFASQELTRAPEAKQEEEAKEEEEIDHLKWNGDLHPRVCM